MNAQKLEKIAELLNAQVNDGAAMGCSALVLKNGEPIFRANAGMADSARGIRWENDTIVRLYSMSKPITSAAVMLLLDRGKLDIHDKAEWFLEGFRNQQVVTQNGLEPVKRAVEIKDLLDMTSGLCYPDRGFPAGDRMSDLFDKFYENHFAGKPTSTIELANEIGRQPLAFHPGESWLYGTSADVLGAIIEVVSGRKYSDFLREELFEPLGMTDTGFYVPEEKLCRFAEIYEPKDEGLVPCEWQHLGLTDFHRKPPAFESGGAGLVSTPDDYARFAAMLLNYGTFGGRRIISENAVRWMTAKSLTPQQKQAFNWDALVGYSYGNLLRIVDDIGLAGPCAHTGAYGWDGWLGCQFENDPQCGYTFLYFVQRCGGLGIRPLRIIKQIVYGAED
ncbi:MAG: serine hydrolase domain-containing protein [Oscillospiraceae bacterium]